MTKFWYKYSLFLLIFIVIAMSTPGYCHPHGSSKEPTSDLDCFNSFDNFDTCWEKIEEFCLDEATGEFKDCHETDEEHHENPDDLTTDDHAISQNYQYSNHCYARYVVSKMFLHCIQNFYSVCMSAWLMSTAVRRSVTPWRKTVT